MHLLFALLFSLPSHAKSERFELGIGGIYRFGAESSIRVVRVKEDSRCGEGVTCFWAGRVVVLLEIRGRGDARKRRSLALSGHRQSDHLSKNMLNVAIPDAKKFLKLVSVQPPKVTGKNVDSKDYGFVFELQDLE